MIDGKHKILIIEDEANIRKLISVNLAARGYEVIEATDARQGLAILQNTLPSMVLLDIKLPDMSGWDVLKTMSEDPAYPQVPVIVITASLGSTNPDFPLHKNENLRKVLKKPVSIQELTREIKQVLVES